MHISGHHAVLQPLSRDSMQCKPFIHSKTPHSLSSYRNKRQGVYLGHSCIQRSHVTICASAPSDNNNSNNNNNNNSGNSSSNSSDGKSSTPQSRRIRDAILGYPSSSNQQSSTRNASSSSPITTTSSSIQSSSQQQQQQQQSSSSPSSTTNTNGNTTSNNNSGHIDTTATTPGTWEWWTAYFNAMDDTVRELDGISEDLQAAINIEDYSSAVTLRNQQQQLEKNDCVNTILENLEIALQEERYADAAMLRDAGGAKLLGWWAGRGEPENDPYGHIINITADFGRYIAHAYTGTSIAEMMGLQEATSSGTGSDFVPSSYGGGGGGGNDGSSYTTPTPTSSKNRGGANSGKNGKKSSNSGDKSFIDDENEFYDRMRDNNNNNTSMSFYDADIDDPGTPVFEVFIRPGSIDTSSTDNNNNNGSTSNGYLQQPVALHAPLSALLLSGGDGELEQLSALIASQVDGGASISVERGEGSDGVGFVRINLTGGPSLGSDPSTESYTRDEDDEDDDNDNDDDGRNNIEIVLDADTLSMNGIGTSYRSPENKNTKNDDDNKDGNMNAIDDALSMLGITEEASSEEMKMLRDTLLNTLTNQPSTSTSSKSDSDTTTIDNTNNNVSGVNSDDIENTEQSESDSVLGYGEVWMEIDGELQKVPLEKVIAENMTPLKGNPTDDNNNDSQSSLIDAIANGSSINSDTTTQQQEEEEEEESGETLSSMGLGAIAQRVAASIEWNGLDEFILTVEEDSDEEIDNNDDGINDSSNISTISEPSTTLIESSSSTLSTTTTTKTLQKKSKQGINKTNDRLDEIKNLLRTALGKAIAEGVGATLDPRDISRGNSAPSTNQEEEDSDDEDKVLGLTGRVTYTRLPIDTLTTDAFSGIYLGSFGPHGPEILRVMRSMMEGEEWVTATKLTGDSNVPAGKVSFRARIGREHRLSPAGVYPPEYGVQQRYKGQGRVAREGYSAAKWVDGELLTFSVSNPLTRGAELGFVFNIDAQRKYLLLFTKAKLDELMKSSR